MEQYIVSARKYRPTNFDAVVGQKHVADTLMREIESNKLAQAFLFTGPRGVGKTTCARILAKVINSQGGEVDPKQDFAFCLQNAGSPIIRIRKNYSGFR